MDNEPRTLILSPAERLRRKTESVAHRIKDKPVKVIDLYTSDEGGPPKLTVDEAVSIAQRVMEIPDEDVKVFDLGLADQVRQASEALRQIEDRKLFVFKYPDNLDRMGSSIGLGNEILRIFAAVERNYAANEKISNEYIIIQSYDDSLLRAMNGIDPNIRLSQVPRIELNPGID